MSTLENSNNNTPDFLVIGAGKSGTTSLDSYLNEHPQIYMSPVKEPNFLAFYGMKEDDFKIEESRYHFTISVLTPEEYHGLFEGAKEGQVLGETSNTYLYGQNSLKNILTFVPNAKFIAIFRQPAERLYSRYLHLARENLLPSKEFEDCLDRNSIWWERPDLIPEGFYFKHLKKFYDEFGAERIKIFLFEDLKEPDKLFPELFSFLGVKADFIPPTDTVFNKSGFVKSKFKNQLIGPNGLIIRSLKSIAPSAVKKLKQSSFMKRKMNDIRSSNLSRPKLAKELKERITNEIYLEDIKNLEHLIERDLSHWY